MRRITIIIAALLPLYVFAQTDLPIGKIEVIKDFEVRITETKKIRIIPQPIPIDSTVRLYQYELLAPSPSIQYVVAELKPLAIEPEQKPTYYPLFAKAGFGNPNSFLGNFSYDHLQSDVSDWGVIFDYLTANNKKIPLQKFSDTRGRLNGSYLLGESLQVDGYIDGQFEKVYFYGAEDIPTNPEVLKRSFNRYDVNFELSNAPVENTSLRYKALLNYLFDKDDLGSRERALRAGSEVQTLIGSQEIPLGFKLLADLSLLKDNEEKRLNNFLFEPFFKYHTGGFKIHLGGIALLKTNANEILPAIEVSYNLFPLVTVRAGWQGEVMKNNFHSLSGYNPYIISRIDSIGNMISRRIFAGIHGKSGIFNYEITAGYTKFEGIAFFLQDQDNHEQFKLVYDDGSFIGVEGALSLGILKYLNLKAKGFTRFYSLDNEEKPWHRPSLGIDAQATYTGGQDIYHVSLIFHGENGLPYRTVGGTETRLDPLLDLNLHADYFFTNSLGGFFEINNILGNNRERWATYPSFGFNAKAGVMVRL